jgi:hypothetical protein
MPHGAREKVAPRYADSAGVLVRLFENELPDLPLAVGRVMEVLAVRLVAEPERRLERQLGIGFLSRAQPGEAFRHGGLLSESAFWFGETART